MNIKRPLNSGDPAGLCTKKPRTYQEENSLGINILENLSNELFCEVFDYLDGYDIYNAFLNLNIRFQNLIFHSCILYKLQSNSYSESQLEHYCRDFIVPNRHRIISLYVTEPSAHRLFQYCAINSSYNRLESITLRGLTDLQLLSIVFYLKSLPCLLSLTIDIDEEYSYLGNIYQLVFSLPTLKYNKISLYGFEELSIQLPKTLNTPLSNIEHLVIDFSCKVTELISLLNYVPQLRHLKCDQLVESDEDFIQFQSLNLLNLKTLCITECQLEFNDFERFIKLIPSQLELLKIFVNWNKSYLNPNRWQSFIKKSMCHLEKFYFHYTQPIDYGFNGEHSEDTMNQFTSSFWVERNWLCDFVIEHSNVILFIHPKRKEWFDFPDHTQIDTFCKQNSIEYHDVSNQSKRLYKPIQMKIADHDWNYQFEGFIRSLKPTFNAVRFTHLNININRMTIGMLLEVLHLLPHLESLELTSLPRITYRLSSVEDTRTFLLVSVTNHIKKIKLDTISDERKIEFLIDLCPRMQYLEMNMMSNAGLTSLIKLIFNHQIRNIPDLCFLCLNVPNADDDTISYISNTIKLAAQVDNYCFKIIDNKILLQLKIR